MRQLTDSDRQKIQEEVERDFPSDPMMQELHAIRLERYYELQDLPLRELIRRYVRPATKARAS